ncbi:MAG TPA: phosphotransferase [Bacillales bacterium]|nr:phosphotransferase [Bacillales bacterium]
MEQFVRNLFSEDLFKRIIACYQIDSNYKNLGDFENYAFEVYRNGTPMILRVTHSSHRSYKELEAEIDWIQYLQSCGISIPAVLLSPSGKVIEDFEAEDSFFFASLFEKAPGHPIQLDDNLFNEELFFIWGKTVGEMHFFTKAYRPGDNIHLRHQWNNNDLLRLDDYFPNDEGEALTQAKMVVKEVEKLPKTKDSFGLIHSDLHQGNFFYENGSIHIFDFDDASYHYFASDIAIPLYYAVNSKHFYGSREERNEFANQFIQAFLAGYREENELSFEWVKTIPLFLKLRDVELFSVFNKKVTINERNERIQHWVHEIKNRIIANIAIVDLDLKDN